MKGKPTNITMIVTAATASHQTKNQNNLGIRFVSNIFFSAILLLKEHRKDLSRPEFSFAIPDQSVSFVFCKTLKCL